MRKVSSREYDSMRIRPALVSDAPDICSLVNHYAELGRMLHRSLESVYMHLRDFVVARDDDGTMLGCVAMTLFWADLAEVKSLAVAPEARGKGVGGRLVEAAVDDARRLGVKRVFALTYEKDFFLRQGFSVIDRDTLPEKVWRECFACPRFDACDEIAMMRRICPDASASRGDLRCNSQPTPARP
jgi:amino-acid N-acetyltransferase